MAVGAFECSRSPHSAHVYGSFGYIDQDPEPRKSFCYAILNVHFFAGANGLLEVTATKIMSNPPPPFWSPETGFWSALCPIPAQTRRVGKLGWVDLHRSDIQPESHFPSLTLLGDPNFLPDTPNQRGKLPAARSRKIELQPTPEQKNILDRWFGCARNTYNMALRLIEGKVCPVNQRALRDQCVTNDLFKGTDQAWRLETPYAIRDEAVADLVKAFKASWASDRSNGFKIKPKRKKATSDSIVIGSRKWKSAGVFFPKFIGKTPIKAREPLPDKLDYDTRLQRTRLGKYYLCVLSPRVKKTGPIPIDDGSSIVAFDPGVRSVLTGYSPDGSVTEIARGESKRLERLLKHLDRLHSNYMEKSATPRQHYQRRRAAHRLRAKIKHLVYDVHHKVAKYLCQNYWTILLPEFGTQNQMKKAGRKIGSKTVRLMAAWSHYRFRKILIDKARSYPWCTIHKVDEYHTTKTCGNCGTLNQQVKSKRMFVCPSCNFRCGRDTNAARNVLLRFMTRDDRVRDWRSYLGLEPGPWQL